MSPIATSQLSRRKFLKGATLTVVSTVLAREAILQTQALDLARQPEDPRIRTFGSGPGDADSFARFLSGGLGGSGTYIRSDGAEARWAALQLADLPAHASTHDAGGSDPLILRKSNGAFTINAGAPGALVNFSVSELPGAIGDYRGVGSTDNVAVCVTDVRLTTLTNVRVSVARTITSHTHNIVALSEFTSTDPDVPGGHLHGIPSADFTTAGGGPASSPLSGNVWWWLLETG